MTTVGNVSVDKKLTDCHWFLKNQCTKGTACEFRHSEAARDNGTICKFWISGQCSNQQCIWRHPSGVQKKIPCIYFPSGSCVKGESCPFAHGTIVNGNSVSSDAFLLEKQKHEEELRKLQEECKKEKERLSALRAQGQEFELANQQEKNNNSYSTGDKKEEVENQIQKKKPQIFSKSATITPKKTFANNPNINDRNVGNTFVKTIGQMVKQNMQQKNPTLQISTKESNIFQNQTSEEMNTVKTATKVNHSNISNSHNGKSNFDGNPTLEMKSMQFLPSSSSSSSSSQQQPKMTSTNSKVTNINAPGKGTIEEKSLVSFSGSKGSPEQTKPSKSESLSFGVKTLEEIMKEKKPSTNNLSHNNGGESSSNDIRPSPVIMSPSMSSVAAPRKEKDNRSTKPSEEAMALRKTLSISELRKRNEEKFNKQGTQKGTTMEINGPLMSAGKRKEVEMSEGTVKRTKTSDVASTSPVSTALAVPMSQQSPVTPPAAEDSNRKKSCESGTKGGDKMLLSEPSLELGDADLDRELKELGVDIDNLEEVDLEDISEADLLN